MAGVGVNFRLGARSELTPRWKVSQIDGKSLKGYVYGLILLVRLVLAEQLVSLPINTN